MARRKAGELIAIEIDILVEALRLTTGGQSEFHGFGIAKELRDGRQSQGLIAHGTLYKALSRLETGGLLESTLEDPDIAAEQGRPRRRLYRITNAGRLAAAASLDARLEEAQPSWYPGIELA
jgi:DNA-binding PadR family transcriptional regulator